MIIGVDVLKTGLDQHGLINCSVSMNVKFVPFMKKIGIDNSMSELTKKIILNQVQRLTEVTDQSIKSMTGSPEYKQYGTLVVHRFIQMLNHYFDLMKKWMEVIPGKQYDTWAEKIVRDGEFNGKSAMISAIEKIYKEKSKSINLHQMESSGAISIAAAKVGTAASFARQFYQQSSSVTLEDLFSLMHQNILASTHFLGKDFRINEFRLPERIHLIIGRLEAQSKVNLLRMNYDYPVVTIEYNIPLRNHSAKLLFDYNTQTRLFTINWHFYGRNWDDRFNLISRVARIEGLLNGAKLVTDHQYNPVNRTLLCGWQFNEKQSLDSLEFLETIVNEYARLTDANDNVIKNLLLRSARITNVENRLKSLPSDDINYIIKELNSLTSSDKKTIFFRYPYLAELAGYNIMISIKDLYENIQNLDFDRFERIVKKHQIKVDPKYTIDDVDETLMHQVFHNFSGEDALKFIEKYTPKTKCKVSAELLYRNDHDMEIFNRLVEYGIVVHREFFECLLDITQENPVIKSEFFREANLWDKKMATTWLYKGLKDIKLDDTTESNSLDVALESRPLEIIKMLFNKLDLYYKEGKTSPTLLELCLLTCRHTEAKLYGLLSNTTIDFSKSPQAIACALKSGYFQLAKVLIDTGVNLPKAKGIDLVKLSSSEQGREVVTTYNERMAKLSNQVADRRLGNYSKLSLFATVKKDNQSGNADNKIASYGA